MLEDGKKKNILGQYELFEVIGRGGMGVVYKARQLSLNRIVAVKVLPPKLAEDPTFVTRFNREAEAIAKLNHPNITQVIDRGEDQGIYYFVMEYIEGKSLAELIKKNKLSFEEIMEFCIQVCDGLSYAHRKGVVHRDIKPGNVLITKDTKKAKIADFGIAQLRTPDTDLATMTQEQVGMGTWDYMSPEQRSDARNVDKRADIYSLGVILYEMITGKLPLGIYDRPSTTKPEIPPEIDEVIFKCMKNEPAERYQSAEELERELTQFRTPGHPITGISRQPKTTGSVVPQQKKSRKLLVSIICIFLLGAGIGIYNFRYRITSSLSTLSSPPSKCRAQFEQAEALAGTGKYKEAQIAYKKIIQDFPDDVLTDDAWLRLGILQEKEGEYEEALSSYLQTISLPGIADRAPEAQLRIADLYLNHIRAPESRKNALVNYQKVYENYPDSSSSGNALYQMGQIYEGEKKPASRFSMRRERNIAGAISAYEKLTRNYPDSEYIDDVLSRLAALYRDETVQQYYQAIDCYRRILKRNPNSPYRCRYEIALIYDENLHELKNAVRVYREVIRKEPGTSQAAKAARRLKQLEPLVKEGWKEKLPFDRWWRNTKDFFKKLKK